ncbi:MAG: hypothetical protein V3R78_07120 [Thermodesulfobacteriota bacterium]
MKPAYAMRVHKLALVLLRIEHPFLLKNFPEIIKVDASVVSTVN